MIQSIRHCLTFAVISLVISSCAGISESLPAGENGKRFAATAPGTWTCNVDAGDGISGQMVKVFNSDGTARGVLLVKKSGAGVSVVMPEIPFTSRWKVDGDVVVTYDMKSPMKGIFKPGQVSRDRIISVQPARMICRDVNGGGLLVFERIGSGR